MTTEPAGLAEATLVRELEELREEFRNLGREAATIKAQLVHEASNAKTDGVGDESKISLFRQHGSKTSCSMKSSGHRKARQCFDQKGNPVFRKEPIPDARGTPITNSAGEAFDVIMPAFRHVEFVGDKTSLSKLEALAVRAGRTASKLPPIPSKRLLAGWSFGDPDGLWWSFVFEIAWAQRHPLLHAKREIWVTHSDNSALILLPYDIEELRRLRDSGLQLANSIPEPWLKRMPEAYVSTIEDIGDASVKALDVLHDETQEEIARSKSDAVKNIPWQQWLSGPWRWIWNNKKWLLSGIGAAILMSAMSLLRNAALSLWEMLRNLFP